MLKCSIWFTELPWQCYIKHSTGFTIQDTEYQSGILKWNHVIIKYCTYYIVETSSWDIDKYLKCYYTNTRSMILLEYLKASPYTELLTNPAYNRSFNHIKSRLSPLNYTTKTLTFLFPNRGKTIISLQILACSSQLLEIFLSHTPLFEVQPRKITIKFYSVRCLC